MLKGVISQSASDGSTITGDGTIDNPFMTNGVSGTFLDGSGNTITVLHGIITSLGGAAIGGFSNGFSNGFNL